MKVLDLTALKAYPYEERQRNVLFQAPEFKVRLIEIPPGGSMPECKMSAYVVFYAMEGEAYVRVDEEGVTLRAGHCLITEPATITMQTTHGVRLVAIQVAKNQ